MTVNNMHCADVLSNFKNEHEAHVDLKLQDDPNFPKVNNRGSDRKTLKWAPVFDKYDVLNFQITKSF